MKKILSVTLALLIVASCDKKNEGSTAGKLKIRGKVKHTDTGYVVLKEVGDTNVIPLDSVKLKDGTFTFEITPKEKTFYYVELFKKQTVFLIGGPKDTLYVEADGDSQMGKFTVKGSKDNEQIKQAADLINEYQKEFNEKQQSYMMLMQQGKTAEAQQLVSSIDAFYALKIKEAKDLINAFGPGLPAMSLAANFISPERDLPFLDTLAQKLKKEIPNSKHTKSFAEFIDKHKAAQSSAQGFALGTPAPDFSASTPTGEWIKLSSLKGKYVLLDFWASWCKPCRQENPNVVKTYNAYKNKNFTILSVSLDEEKEAWVAAIKKDGLTWSQVSDLKGWGSDIAALYHVQGIPATFLVDPDGKIIAQNLRGDALEAKLKEVLK